MPTVTFTKDDIASGHLVEKPDWYDYEVAKVTEKPAKTDGSPNYWVSFRGFTGEMSGVLVTKLFSSKAGWAMVPLFRALNGGKDPSEGQAFDLNEALNCKVSAMTRRGDFNGSPINDLVDFKPYKG